MRIASCLLALVVTAACGEVTTSGNDNPSPTVESVSPDRGGTLGRTVITVTGTGFVENGAGDTFVIANGLIAGDIQVLDDSTLTFVLPPGEPEQVIDILVFNENGFGALPNAIQYNPEPVVSSLSPPIIRRAGGTVTVFGAGFDSFDPGQNEVLIGGTPAESVEVLDDNTLEVTVGQRPDDVLGFAPLDLQLQNDNGVAGLAEALQYTGQGLLLFGRRPGNIGGSGYAVTYVDLDSDPVRVERLPGTLNKVQSAVFDSTGQMYIILGQCRSGNQQLATFDPLTGESTHIGRLEDATDIERHLNSLSFVGEDLISYSKTLQRLVRIDPETGEFVALGGVADGTASCCSQGKGFVTNDATTLYRMRFTNGPIELQSAVDSTVSASTVPPLSGFPFVYPVMDMMEDGANFLALTRQDPEGLGGESVIFSVDSSTGAEEVLVRFPDQTYSAFIRTPDDY